MSVNSNVFSEQLNTEAGFLPIHTGIVSITRKSLRFQANKSVHLCFTVKDARLPGQGLYHSQSNEKHEFPGFPSHWVDAALKATKSQGGKGVSNF